MLLSYNLQFPVYSVCPINLSICTSELSFTVNVIYYTKIIKTKTLYRTHDLRSMPNYTKKYVLDIFLQILAPACLQFVFQYFLMQDCIVMCVF